MFKLVDILALLPKVGPAAAALPEFKKVYDQIVATFKEHDQVTLREAYVELMADNDAGHQRLQDKLRQAQG